MYAQHGGVLPVYMGSRSQRGGGILSSLARFFLPTAKRMLTETVKAAPGIVDNILNQNQSAGSAILSGLKTAGRNTATSTLRQLESGGAKKRPAVAKRRVTKHRKKVNQRDIFT